MQFQDFIRSAKKYGILKLQKETGLSRSHIYSILSGKTDPSWQTLQKLLAPLGYEPQFKKRSFQPTAPRDLNNSDYIIWNLVRFGAPLFSEKNFEAPLDINQALISALRLGREKAQINAILPYFIHRNWEQFHWKNILKEASESELRYLGYLLNLIIHFTNNLEISELLTKIREKVGKTLRTEKLVGKGKISKFEKKKFETTQNMIADSWRFKTSDSLAGIAERFKKWQMITT